MASDNNSSTTEAGEKNDNTERIAMLRVSRDYMPRSGLKLEDAKRWVVDPNDEKLVQNQFNKMTLQTKDLKQMIQMALKKRMAGAAQEQCLKVGEFHAGGWNDLKQSWKTDHGKENGKKVWMALCGTFDGKEGKEFLDTLERHCLQSMGWVYNDETTKSDSKQPTGFVHKMISQQKGELVKQVLEPVMNKSGITLGITRDKDEINNGKKGWRHKPGKFEDCFYKIARTGALAEPEVMHDDSDVKDIHVEELRKNLAVAERTLKVQQVKLMHLCCICLIVYS